MVRRAREKRFFFEELFQTIVDVLHRVINFIRYESITLYNCNDKIQMNWCGLGSQRNQGDNQIGQFKTNSKPQSKVFFGANGVQQKKFDKNNDYKLIDVTKKQMKREADENRKSDYGDEEAKAKQSQLILSKEVLNYELDSENGITKNPVINTFHYDTVLSHAFVQLPDRNI